MEVPRIRHGKRQTLNTLTGEEAYPLAKFLRSEKNKKNSWVPRLPSIYAH